MISVNVESKRGEFSLVADFDSDAGLIGLFGPSGSGKTTLIHLIAGLLRPSRGRIEIDGQTNLDLVRLSNLEGRSKRRQIAVLVRVATALWKQNPDDYQRLLTLAKQER